jgi:hypothetical protein
MLHLGDSTLRTSEAVQVDEHLPLNARQRFLVQHPARAFYVGRLEHGRSGLLETAEGLTAALRTSVVGHTG